MTWISRSLYHYVSLHAIVVEICGILRTANLQDHAFNEGRYLEPDSKASVESYETTSPVTSTSHVRSVSDTINLFLSASKFYIYCWDVIIFSELKFRYTLESGHYFVSIIQLLPLKFGNMWV